MHVACCQLDIAWEDKPENYRRVESLVSAARLPPNALLLLPEMFATGFTMNARAAAEPLDGPTARFVADLAGRHQLFIQAGIVVAQGDGAPPRNESLTFSPDGQRLARYAKLHLFSFAGEPVHYAPGDGTVVFRWQNATVAPSICYDLRFPELYRRSVADGAELLSVIACWPAPRDEHWLALLRARAIENQCYVVAVNRHGCDPSGLAYAGRSQIIDPRGRVLADAGGEACVIQAEIDMASLAEYRRQFPALNDRVIK